MKPAASKARTHPWWMMIGRIAVTEGGGYTVAPDDGDRRAGKVLA
jgi:hypothetical protein